MTVYLCVGGFCAGSQLVNALCTPAHPYPLSEVSGWGFQDTAGLLPRVLSPQSMALSSSHAILLLDRRRAPGSKPHHYQEPFLLGSSQLFCFRITSCSLPDGFSDSCNSGPQRRLLHGSPGSSMNPMYAWREAGGRNGKASCLRGTAEHRVAPGDGGLQGEEASSSCKGTSHLRVGCASQH